MSTSTVLEYAPAAPLTRGRLAARLALYTFFAATGVVLGAIAGRLIAPTPHYRLATFLALDSNPPGLPPVNGTRAIKPSDVPTAAQTIVTDLNSPTFRRRTADLLARTYPTSQPLTADALAEKVAITYITNTTLIRVEATDADPRLAAAIANAAARAAVTTAQLRIMSTATPPGIQTVNTRLWQLGSAILAGIGFPLFCWFVTRHERAAEPAVA